MNGCEAWTLTKEIQRKIEAAEMWFFRRMLRVPWTARKTNEEVLKETETIRSLMNRVQRRQANVPLLDRELHTEFLLRGLKHLSGSYQCLDSSRPWLCYWILHSLELLDSPITEDHALNIAHFLGKCQDPEGGFAGGPMQYPHLAPTYAAVNALCILANITEKVFDILNREKLYSFLMRMRTPDGAFKMHDGGEVDIRGVYCALSVARLTNIMTKDLVSGTVDFIVRCQTYEGGFAGYPGLEAHGGYTFCGIAGLVLLGHTERCDLRSLLVRILLCPLFRKYSKNDDQNLSATRWMFNQEALQEYILICCQHDYGGLLDKPLKPRDYYHTCYCLSGLSVAQHFIGGHLQNDIVIGSTTNKLRALQPVYNLSLDSVMMAQKHFGNMKLP
ncbi:protein farnesyltransferase subunit beta [Elysia marginata]|uniref:Protein farnesyltransferase subunit beta n=1 Tax=Elysia marginata TaxID=1093978 RepID=A0AAV4F0C3_9GAST|nr:protein farnesyltransferase subunit beta [Elysia marginata]